MFFFFKQKTAYEMRISDWSSDVCSSDLLAVRDDIFDLGHASAEKFLDIGQILDPRRDEEALPAAIMLAQQRLADDHRVPRRHIGPHRQPVDRRRLDDRRSEDTRLNSSH